MLEALLEPTRSITTMIVFGSMRVGEVLALGWKRISSARISVVWRVYDREFDDMKTNNSGRGVPLDRTGIIAQLSD
jgi:integrase